MTFTLTMPNHPIQRTPDGAADRKRWADMRIVDDHEVSKSEQVTRFVCGALLGVVIAVAITYKFDVSTLIGKTGIALVSILGCGILAWVHGDRFWLAIFGAGRLR